MSESSRGILTFYFPLVVLLPYCATKHKERKKGFPGGSDGKASTCSEGDQGSIPGLGRSLGEGNSNPLQDSCLENSMDGEAWWATVHGVPKSRTISIQLLTVSARGTVSESFFIQVWHFLLPHPHLRQGRAAACSEGYIWLLFSLSSMSSPTHWLPLYTS